MMIVKSKQYTKAYQKLEAELKSIIYNFAYDRGLDCFFIEDSKRVQESIGTISSRIASLLEGTYLIKHQIGARKAFEKTPKKRVVKE